MKYIFSVLILISFLTGSNAQTPYIIDQNTSKSAGGDNQGMGSSFLTTAAGKLDSIEVYIRTGSYSTGTLYVYEGNTTGSASQIYTQSLTGIPTGILNAPYMAKLTAPVSLTAASTYTFMIYNTPLRFGYSDIYADGSLWIGAGAWITEGQHIDKDLDFIAYIGNPITTGLIGPKNNEMAYLINDNTISLKNFDAEEILVYNLLGKTIASGSGEKLQINTAFAEGIYILSARKGNELHTTRIYLKP